MAEPPQQLNMKPRRADANPWRDGARFLKTLLGNPQETGAVSPSGRVLARAMARAVPSVNDGLVIELGPGTGPVTRALIESGVAASRLVLVEYDGDFCQLLRERFPAVRVVQGDAYRLVQTLADCRGRRVDAVVSSLPLLNQPPARRNGLFDDAFALMGSDGVFVQFTYGPNSPIPLDHCQPGYLARASRRVWRNIPPARVWTYRTAPSAAGQEMQV